MNFECAYKHAAERNLLLSLLLLRTALAPYWQSLVHLKCACSIIIRYFYTRSRKSKWPELVAKYQVQWTRIMMNTRLHSSVRIKTCIRTEVIWNKICTHCVIYYFKKSLQTLFTQIKNSYSFKDMITSKSVPADHLVVFNVTSLFTNVPFKLVKQSIKNRWSLLEKNTFLPQFEIERCIEFCDESYFFPVWQHFLQTNVWHSYGFAYFSNYSGYCYARFGIKCH